ncbi:carboxypeptidase regulatory-like domain-containing protein [Granulicella sp. WH15]|uniref:carboxypeptidase-like regulatory domain-containing protein n=1 Tax=Granulicella sp. WH15 TaxID=2602070 RepID=UPI001367403A|nr:carboxypeptidase-like regulatory domain-containing protein [Granulicella sp. WH15]QHN04758.1 carboxypeptidase regulatory-like domain-containing protein [Granulicella sp. WH15]
MLMRIAFLPFVAVSLCGGYTYAQAGETGSVQGIVLDEARNPIPYATVYGTPGKDMHKPLRATADAEGKFILLNLPPGVVYLDAANEHEGYVHSIFSFYVMPGERKPVVNLHVDEAIHNTVIQIGPKAAYLQLNIHDESGNPLQATLNLSRPNMGHSGDLSSSKPEDGVFPVPPVPFHVGVFALGYEPWDYADADSNDRDGLLRIRSGETLNLDICLHKDTVMVRSSYPPYGHALAPRQQLSIDSSFVQSVSEALRATEAIKPGMSRRALLTAFTEEGGLSSRTRRTYVSKACPYLKVDVDFNWSHTSDNETAEMDDDKVANISTPYLQYTVAD